MSMPIAKDASREGACRDGALVRVTPTTALLANGEFGMAAGRLTIVPIDPAAVARVQRWKDALAHGGIDVAPSAEVLARDELLEAFHDPSRDLERGLEERFRTKVLAYPRVGWASLGAMTRGALAVLRDAKLPCTERVHLWVAEALARGGSTYADDESELAERARRLFRNGLARGCDARAVVEMVVSGVPSFVLVREDRARALIDR
jgi:hypothetical protein